MIAGSILEELYTRECGELLSSANELCDVTEVYVEIGEGDRNPSRKSVEKKNSRSEGKTEGDKVKPRKRTYSCPMPYVVV